MNLRSRNYLAIVLATLTFLHAAQTLPLEDTGKDKYEPGHKTEKPRYARETLENIQIASTTPAPLPEDSTETAPTSAPLCDEQAREASTCRTLKERLREDLNITHHLIQYPLQGVLNAFSLDDLIYFDLLGEGTPAPLSDTPGTALIGDRICNSTIQHHYRPLSVDLGPCAWRYNCTHSFERFPTIKIQAELKQPSNFDNGMCDEVLMENDVVYYQREACVGDPCRTENWRRNYHRIPVGYKIVPQS